MKIKTPNSKYMKETSEYLSINLKDILKGLLFAVASAVITTIQTSLQAGSLDFNWKLIETVAVGAGVAYMSKKFFTGPKDSATTTQS